MDRLRTILYEASLVFLCGVVIASVITIAWSATHRLTIERFKREYSRGMTADQQAIADTYINVFSVAELMQAVEEQNVDGTCHIQGHPIGRALYKTNPNFTEGIRQCGSSCTYGCFHGVMLQMFDTDSDTLGGVIEDETPEEYLAHVKTVAKDLCRKPEVQSVVQLRTCYHGLGHVFESMEHNDLGKGLHDCGIFKNAKEAEACVTGVFMEHLFNPSALIERNTKGEEPCSAYPQYTKECFIYKAYGWVTAWGGVAPAMKACDSFGDRKLICIRDVARVGANVKMLETSAGFNALCGAPAGDEYKQCVLGAFLKIIYLNNGDDSDAACADVAKPFREACVQVLHAYLADNI